MVYKKNMLVINCINKSCLFLNLSIVFLKAKYTSDNNPKIANIEITKIVIVCKELKLFISQNISAKIITHRIIASIV